jgi:hypothetical protein
MVDQSGVSCICGQSTGKDGRMAYTDDEKAQMRNAAFGAVFLVSKAEPGMIDMVKESFAASKAMTKATGEMQGVFKSGGMPKIPKGDPSSTEQSVLAGLSSSVQMISTKAPQDVDAYRHVVLDACTSAAEAGGGGVSGTETQMLSKVMSALGMS